MRSHLILLAAHAATILGIALAPAGDAARERSAGAEGMAPAVASPADIAPLPPPPPPVLIAPLAPEIDDQACCFRRLRARFHPAPCWTPRPARPYDPHDPPRSPEGPPPACGPSCPVA